MQFGTLVLIGILLAKSGMPTGQISIYEAWLFIASLYCFYWVSGGQNTLLQLYPKLEESAKPKALFNVFVLFVAAGLATGGLLWWSQDWVARGLTNFEALPHLGLLSIFLALHSPTFLIQGYGAVSFSLQLCLVVLPVFLGATLREVVLGLVAWAAFKFAWGLVLLARHAHWQLDYAFLKKYLHLSLPLVLFALIGKGSEYISGLMVTALIEDEKAFAVFRYGAREFPLAVLMVGALATSLLPEAAENLEKGLQRIKTTTRRLSHLLYPLSMASMLAAPLLFPLIFNPDFKDSAKLFNIFTLLLSSRILLPQVVAMGQGKNYILTLSALAEMAVLLMLSYWLGTRFGLEGIAYAAILAFMVDRLILLFYNWKALGIHPGRYVDWKNYLAYNAALVAVFLVSLQY
jgi:hypothetical protein